MARRLWHTNGYPWCMDLPVTVLADACVPLKVFFGHVMALRDKADCLFIPRMSRELNVPVLTFFLDEQTAKAGVIGWRTSSTS